MIPDLQQALDPRFVWGSRGSQINVSTIGGPLDNATVAYFHKSITSSMDNGWDGGALTASLLKVDGTAYASALTGVARVIGGSGDAVGVQGRAEQMQDVERPGLAGLFGGWFFAAIGRGVRKHTGATGFEANLSYGSPISSDHFYQGRAFPAFIGNIVSENVLFSTLSKIAGGLYFGVNESAQGNGARLKTGLYFEQDVIAPEDQTNWLGETIFANGSRAAANAATWARLAGHFSFGLDLWRGMYSRGVFNFSSAPGSGQLVRDKNGALWLQVACDFRPGYGLKLDLIPT
jgi:hypothetical protein